MKCKLCGKKINRKSKGHCIKCSTKKIEIEKSKIYISEWLSGKYILKGRPRTRIRNFLLEGQKYKCAICKMSNIWNDKEIIFICDHIDGDSTNNIRENLRMICPNCDSQLPTYKSKNKNSSRKYDKGYRKRYYHIRKINPIVGDGTSFEN